MRAWIRRTFRRPKRIDHHPMYVAVVFATGVWAASLLLFGPTESSVISELSISTQYMLAFVTFVGSFLCQFGIFVGTRWAVLLPSWDVRVAYAFGIGGIPSIAFALEVYFVAIVWGSTTPITSALGASVSFAIPIGALWNMMMFVVRRWEIDDYINMRNTEKRCDEDDLP